LTDRSGTNLDSWELIYADENLIHRQNFYSTSTDLINIVLDTPCGVLVKKDQDCLMRHKIPVQLRSVVGNEQLISKKPIELLDNRNGKLICEK
uniref:Uncharacterized protein n=2 Tax=Panagrolaimus sp. JU765 TaxID=591449 RepID=A0AC34PY11_9BILA